MGIYTGKRDAPTAGTLPAPVLGCLPLQLQLLAQAASSLAQDVGTVPENCCGHVRAGASSTSTTTTASPQAAAAAVAAAAAAATAAGAFTRLVVTIDAALKTSRCVRGGHLKIPRTGATTTTRYGRSS